MASHSESLSPIEGNWRLITIGALLAVGSLLVSGWLLLTGEFASGSTMILLVLSGIFFVAIGAQSSQTRS